MPGISIAKRPDGQNKRQTNHVTMLFLYIHVRRPPADQMVLTKATANIFQTAPVDAQSKPRISRKPKLLRRGKKLN